MEIFEKGSWSNGSKNQEIVDDNQDASQVNQDSIQNQSKFLRIYLIHLCKEFMRVLEQMSNFCEFWWRQLLSLERTDEKLHNILQFGVFHTWNYQDFSKFCQQCVESFFCQLELPKLFVKELDLQFCIKEYKHSCDSKTYCIRSMERVGTNVSLKISIQDNRVEISIAKIK